MTELEIQASIEEVFKQLLREIPFEEKWDKSQIRTGLESAITSINSFNPKNCLNETLASAPPHWRHCLEAGAAAYCFGRNAPILKESDPQLAARCREFAKFHEGQFKALAKLLTQIRPTSGASGRRNR